MKFTKILWFAIFIGVFSFIGKLSAIKYSQKEHSDYTASNLLEGSSVADITGEKLKQLHSGLKLAAAQTNAKSPQMIDKETRLDKVVVTNETTLSLMHTLVNYSSSEVDPTIATKDQRDDMIAKNCADEELRLLYKFGAVMVYIYAGRDQKEIGRFAIDYKSCK